ncbi:DUF6515 family protein [Tenacibaculum sp. nBUS_03]|uniref:DUF6515 family protein n=1 Tax=Tenacibaculum sp. nBUS_03 TaxID=3395320 RepID=UPI003EBA7A97
MRSLLIIIGLVFTVLTTSCAPRVVVKKPRTKKVVVVKRPAKYKIVRIKGKKYYFWNGRYHRKTSRGYIVVRI